MKVAILAGGFGTRLAEETENIPKPMIRIGEMPILLHIMKIYSYYGFKEFIIALGYKSEYIKRYMVDYVKLQGDISIDFDKSEINVNNNENVLDWKIELVETGKFTQTGGRIKKLQPFIKDNTFMLTWGDGLADIDINSLVKFHKSHGKLATLTAVRPPARYGYMKFSENKVIEFTEKPQIGEGWINGAFFVLEPGVFDYIDGDDTVWEHEPLENLARDGKLMAFKHDSFWQCMDTFREKHILERMWESERAPWKVWED
jgi:glucose-1-phosphate cytidylyltransferase